MPYRARRFLRLEDVDLKTELVTLYGKGGKGGKVRRVRIGAKTARALSCYLRARAKRKGADLPNLWLADRGGPYAHQWKLVGGDTGDLMLLLGLSSDAMPRHYGASAAADRAQQTQARMGIGDNV